jgi:hypothetical protein
MHFFPEVISQSQQVVSIARAIQYWNVWFLVAYIGPPVIFFFLPRNTVGRFFACVVSFLLFIICYYFGVGATIEFLARSAKTGAEIQETGMDTAMVFAPLFRGVPFGVVWIGLILIANVVKSWSDSFRADRDSATELTQCSSCGRELSVTTQRCPRCMKLVETTSSLSYESHAPPGNPYVPPAMNSAQSMERRRQ